MLFGASGGSSGDFPGIGGAHTGRGGGRTGSLTISSAKNILPFVSKTQLYHSVMCFPIFRINDRSRNATVIMHDLIACFIWCCDSCRMRYALSGELYIQQEPS